MRTTIDSAGRVVIPKALRDAAGLYKGPVDIVLAGNGVQIEVPEAFAELTENEDGFLVVKESAQLTDEDVQRLRDDLQLR